MFPIGVVFNIFSLLPQILNFLFILRMGRYYYMRRENLNIFYLWGYFHERERERDIG